MNIWSLANSEKNAFEFYQEKGLLQRPRECKNVHKKKKNNKSKKLIFRTS